MRIALGIEYDGHTFYGWQAQTGLVTIQNCLETALSTIAAEPIKIFCAGRTDAGVHATGQVVHFDTQVIRPQRAWIKGVNAHLPPAIAVRWMQVVNDDFHARFSAVARRYRYVIYTHKVRPAILASRVTWCHYSLDDRRMQAGADFLLGEHDCSSLRSSRCESKTPMRNIHFVNISRQGNFIIMDIQANAFLHHMVRNIAGVLIRIGIGEAEPVWMATVLAAKDRRAAATTASATGLYLSQVIYPATYSFPENQDSFPHFIGS
jgi:tRNA pseudouridine38-40 synthase